LEQAFADSYRTKDENNKNKYDLVRTFYVVGLRGRGGLGARARCPSTLPWPPSSLGCHASVQR